MKRSKSYPVECDSRIEPGSPYQTVRGDCARICPIPRLSKHLPKRLQDIVSQWRAEKRNTNP